MNDQQIRDLALQAAQGNAPAFQELYRLTRKGAWFVALSITRSEQDAQDILQESYFKAFKSMDQLAQPESFVPWLNQIVANKAKNYITHKKPDSFAEYGDENAQDWQEETDPSFLPDEHLDQAEARALIASLVKALPVDQRLVVLLRYYDDMEVAAIAKSLEIPEGTVKSRLGRARQKLAAMLQQAQGKGLKLYSMAPIPLLAYFIKLLGFDAPGSDRLPPLLIGSAAAGTAAAGGAAAAGAVKKAPLALGKAAAIAAAAVVAVGGLTAAGVYAYNRAAVDAAVTAAQTDEAVVEHSEPQAASALFPTLPLNGSSAPAEPGSTAPAQASGADSQAHRSTPPATTVAGASETEKPSATTAKATTRATVTTAQRTTWTWPTYTYVGPTTTVPPTTTTAAPTTTLPPTTTAPPATTTAPPTTPAKEYEYNVDGGGNITIIKYVGTQVNVIVPAQIDGKPVKHLGASAFEGTNLARVEISYGIDCIRDRTFADCPDLEEIVVPDSVITVMGSPFGGSPKIVLVCTENSTAHRYAAGNGIAFRLV